jgi:Holliday junction resolvasome RuvABC endonuclease subunit
LGLPVAPRADAADALALAVTELQRVGPLQYGNSPARRTS